MDRINSLVGDMGYYNLKKHTILWINLLAVILSVPVGVTILYIIKAADSDEATKMMHLLSVSSMIIDSVITHFVGLLGALYDHFGLTVLFGVLNLSSACVWLMVAVIVSPFLWLPFIFEVVLIVIAISFAHDVRKRSAEPVVTSLRMAEMGVPTFSQFPRQSSN